MSTVPTPPPAPTGQQVSIVQNPPNPTGILTTQVKIQTVGNPQPLPTIKVPDGFYATLKSKVTNAGILFLGFDSVSANGGQTSFYDLYQGEKLLVGVHNLSVIWLDGQTAGDILEIFVEQS